MNDEWMKPARRVLGNVLRGEMTEAIEVHGTLPRPPDGMRWHPEVSFVDGSADCLERNLITVQTTWTLAPVEEVAE